MKGVSFILSLLLFLLAGCEIEKDPTDLLQGSPRELTDGYCLVSGDQVVLNHNDIEYYDYGAHLIYLKDHMSSDELLEEAGGLRVYAGGEEIYTVGIQPGYSSFMSQGPIIWTHPTFYPDNILAIDYRMISGSIADIREDPRIVEALEKYGQYQEGLHAEITSIWYGPPDELRLNLKLHNRDQVNYYYLDPEKMGMGLYHYFTNGVLLRDTVEHQSCTHQVEHIQPYPWDSWDLDWMSLLEGHSSVSITISYNNFESVPPGTYSARFMFPGLGYQVERDELAQQHGQIWLGKLQMTSEVVVE